MTPQSASFNERVPVKPCDDTNCINWKNHLSYFTAWCITLSFYGFCRTLKPCVLYGLINISQKKELYWSSIIVVWDVTSHFCKRHPNFSQHTNYYKSDYMAHFFYRDAHAGVDACALAHDCQHDCVNNNHSYCVNPDKRTCSHFAGLWLHFV